MARYFKHLALNLSISKALEEVNGSQRVCAFALFRNLKFCLHGRNLRRGRKVIWKIKTWEILLAENQ